MPSREEHMQPADSDTVRIRMTKLQETLEDLPGSACLASAYLPTQKSFDGLVGGDPDILALVVEDAIWRTYEFFAAERSQETAEKVLINAMEHALGRRVMLGEPSGDRM